ncbi:MAG: sugar phosphate isomerase/epimerase [Mariniphaga sp.]|nr:sugar phosphate isomerase/epimerase [Mariniphaga sp.]
MKRRHFNKLMVSGAVGLSAMPGVLRSATVMDKSGIRFGGPVFEKYTNPEEWVKAVKNLGFSAAYCPVQPGEKSDVVKAYEKAANDADIIISEVGAWSNPIDPDDAKASAAIKKCIDSLELAEQINANCCVNISGSRNPNSWDGPHKDNLTFETFDLIVETTRKIIDAVKPKRTFFTLETMPWAYPDSVDSYLNLIKAIDRKEFAVHLDPVNMVNTPTIYYRNGEMIKDAFKKLGPWIKNCHAKDTLIDNHELTLHISEARPGLGILDYRVFLTEVAKLDNVPLMLEHLNTAEEYNLAAKHIRSVGEELGFEF